MQWRKALWAAGAVAGMLLAPSSLRAQGDYLDVYVAKVKPEKAAEAEALARKIADINRRNNGDRVVAMETVYGDGYAYQFVTERQDYADIDKGNDAFMGALNKALGKQGAEKLLNDWSACLISAHTEVRMRRPDLSRKVPADAESFAKLIGTSRVLRTTVVHVRPGHVPDLEAFLKEAKERGERSAQTQPVLVSQVVEGGHGATFYVTAFRGSLGGFDKNPTLKEILGDDLYAKFQKMNAESIQTTESAMYRFRPDMSYPPDQIAETSADFWNPKPVMAAAKTKSKSAAAATEAAAADKPDKPRK